MTADLEEQLRSWANQARQVGNSPPVKPPASNRNRHVRAWVAAGAASTVAVAALIIWAGTGGGSDAGVATVVPAASPASPFSSPSPDGMTDLHTAAVIPITHIGRYDRQILEPGIHEGFNSLVSGYNFVGGKVTVSAQRIVPEDGPNDTFVLGIHFTVTAFTGKPSFVLQHASVQNVPAPATYGIIKGQLLAVGGAQLASSKGRPLSGHVKATDENRKSFVASTSSDGNFVLRVPAGTYSLTGTSPQFGNGGYGCVSQTKVKVARDHTAMENVACDEK